MSSTSTSFHSTGVTELPVAFIYVLLYFGLGKPWEFQNLQGICYSLLSHIKLFVCKHYADYRNWVWFKQLFLFFLCHHVTICHQYVSVRWYISIWGFLPVLPICYVNWLSSSFMLFSFIVLNFASILVQFILVVVLLTNMYFLFKIVFIVIA